MIMRVLFFTYLACVVILVTSCQNNKNSSNMNTDCVNNPQLCQSNVYSQTPGFTPYNYYGFGGYSYNNQYLGGTGPFYYLNNSAYLCNCPGGTVPTYNSYSGLGCVQSNMLGGGYGYAYYGYSASNNNQWVNIPQISNLSGYTNNGCYNGVVQSCIVNGPATCSSGYTCRSSSAASALGMCVSNGANGQSGQIFR